MPSPPTSSLRFGVNASFSELQRQAERAAPELEAAEGKARDVVARPAEAAEIADVTAEADVLREQAHHAAADVHAEVVLRIHREQLAQVLDVGPEQAHAGDGIRTHRR